MRKYRSTNLTYVLIALFTSSFAHNQYNYSNSFGQLKHYCFNSAV